MSPSTANATTAKPRRATTSSETVRHRPYDPDPDEGKRHREERRVEIQVGARERGEPLRREDVVERTPGPMEDQRRDQAIDVVLDREAEDSEKRVRLPVHRPLRAQEIH